MRDIWKISKQVTQFDLGLYFYFAWQCSTCDIKAVGRPQKWSTLWPSGPIYIRLWYTAKSKFCYLIISWHLAVTSKTLGWGEFITKKVRMNGFFLQIVRFSVHTWYGSLNKNPMRNIWSTGTAEAVAGSNSTWFVSIISQFVFDEVSCQKSVCLQKIVTQLELSLHELCFK